jgi:hypothetical protein
LSRGREVRFCPRRDANKRGRVRYGFQSMSRPTARLKTGAIYLTMLAIPRPRRVFRPTDRVFIIRPFASDLERHGGVLRLVEHVAVPTVFELVQDSAGQFGGLYS